jgi:hypothetical protein
MVPIAMMYLPVFVPAGYEPTGRDLMLSLLSKEKKILLAATVIVFLVAAALIWQTYQTMQIFNAADMICKSVPVNMERNDLIRLANNNRTSISFMAESGQTDQAILGFTDKTSDACGCVVSLANDRVSSVGDTYCRSAAQ